MQLYSVYDKKGDEYSSPFKAHTHGDASRSITSTLMKGGTMLNQFPEDYVLYYVGDFNVTTGLLTPLESPVHVANIAILLANLPQQSHRSTEVDNG